MAYPILLLIMIVILAGFLLAGRGDLTGSQRRGMLIGLAVAAAAMLGLLAFFITTEDDGTGATTTEQRLLAALEAQDPAEMAALTRFAEVTLDDPIAAARGFLFDADRRLVICVDPPEGGVYGAYLRRNSIDDDFDRDTRTESALRAQLGDFCAAAF